MNRKIILTGVICGTLCSSAIAQRIIQRRPAQEQATRKRDAGTPLDSVKSIFPNTLRIDKINNYWNAAKDKNGNTLGFVFSSLEYGKENKGFGDDVPTWVITDKKGIIKKVCIINSYETRSYQRLVHRKKFYQQWIGKSLEESKSMKVDIVSGATLTSTAIKNNMQLIIDNALKNKPANR